MLHDLHEHEAQGEVPLGLAAGQPEVLDLEAPAAVLGRYDAPVEGNRVALLLDLALQVGEVALDQLVRLAVDLAVRLEPRNLLFEGCDLVFKRRNLASERLFLGSGVDDVLVRLQATEHEQQVTADDQRHADGEADARTQARSRHVRSRFHW